MRHQYLDEIFNALHNAKFRENQLEDGNPAKDLQLHSLGDGYQTRATKNMLKYFPKKLLPQLLKQFMNLRYHPTFLTMAPEEEQLLQECIAGIEKGEHTIFLLNHDHLGNFLMVILKMMLVAQKMHKPAINNDIYMIVGGLVKTNKWQDIAMNVFAHTIVTQPTDNTPPELREVYAWVRTQTKQHIFSILSLDDQGNPLPQSSERGKLLLINPYGTREVVAGTENSPLFYLPDESHISNKTTFSLIKTIQQS
ncbi:MAG: hypothetical protein LBD75_01220 [Candidatus Peribacteria bacterium]|nr:hypothetical protein [Candidatus Peribacteria bacterium]